MQCFQVTCTICRKTVLTTVIIFMNLNVLEEENKCISKKHLVNTFTLTHTYTKSHEARCERSDFIVICY